MVNFRSANTIKILNHLKESPKATIAELPTVAGINTSAVQKQLATLSSKGYIVKDEDKNKKSWHVIILPTTE